MPIPLDVLSQGHDSLGFHQFFYCTFPTYGNVGSKYDVSIFFQTEFHPGVPWKGLQNIDPENDPDVTPGSVPTGPTINTTIQDVNRYLLKSGGSVIVLCSVTYCLPSFLFHFCAL